MGGGEIKLEELCGEGLSPAAGQPLRRETECLSGMTITMHDGEETKARHRRTGGPVIGSKIE